MWSDQKKLTQAADDIVWEGDGPDAFPPARRLMFAAMRKAITPFHVWEVLTDSLTVTQSCSWVFCDELFLFFDINSFNA